MPTSRPHRCSIASCPNPGSGRARAGDLCTLHWSAWEASPEREDLRGDRIQHAPDAWFRFLERIDGAFRALNLGVDQPEAPGSSGTR